MQSITFECETITPMFLSGADGQTPELRAPSIKGALRFWWRAVNGHLGLLEMSAREGKIFGSTQYGRSKVIIKIEEDMEWDKRFAATPTPHNPRFTKNAFRVGQRFSITLALTKSVRLDDNEYFTLKDLGNLFLLTATLGGIGGRVRRGFGAFNIIQVKNTTETFKQPKTIKEILSLLSPSNFRIVDKKIISQGQRGNQYPYIKEIEIGSPNADIIKKIGYTTHDVKGINKYNYENALGHARGRSRLASPIYVSILKTMMGLRPIIVTLNTALLKENKRIDYQLQRTFKNKIL